MRESTASILNNTKAMFIAQGITWVSSFFLMLFLPRYLGSESYGRLYFAISLTLLAGNIIDLGLSSFFVKEVARDKSKVNLFFTNAIFLRIIAWLIVIAGIFLYASGYGYSGETLKILLILAFGTLLTSLSDLTYRIFQSFEKLSYRSIAVVIERVFLSIIAVPMLISGYGAVSIAIVMTLSVVISFIASAYLLPKLVKIKFEFNLASWKFLLKGALPFFISIVFSYIYFRIDVVMLSAMTNDNVVGWYGASYKLFDTLMFFPAILHLAVFPVFSRLWNESRERFAQTAGKVLKVSTVASVLISFLLIALAKPIVGILFGLKDYENSIILLQGLAVCLPLVYINFVTGTADVSADKQKECSVISILAAVINIGLNFWMIPYFQSVYSNGAIGATIATLITEVFATAMFIYILPSGCFSTENIIIIAKTLAAGIISGVLLWYIESILNMWYVSGIIGSVVYTLILIASRVLTKAELNIFASFLTKNRLAGEKLLEF